MAGRPPPALSVGARPGCLRGAQLTQGRLAGAFLQNPRCRSPHLLLLIQALFLKLTHLLNLVSGLLHVCIECIDFVEPGGADRNSISE